MTPTLLASVVCPTPEPLAATPDDGGDAAYLALAKKLRVRCPFIVRREIEEALLTENIRIYDKNTVKAWMDGLVTKENARLMAEWVAKNPGEKIRSPLEEILAFDGWPSNPFIRRGPSTVRWGWCALRTEDTMKGLLGEDIYSHVVPFGALETMRKIAERVPDAAFLVSDYKVELPDPFLMVTHKLLGPDGYIVERWSEPGFRG
jgi:hypothetical protein